eukprot:CRZ05183.1 hypothetical protein [Spongospora subterranea]
MADRQAERQTKSAKDRSLRKHWLVIAVLVVTTNRIIEEATEKKRWADINRGLMTRRTNLIMVLRKYARTFKENMRQRRLQRSVTIVRHFFADTDTISRTYPICVLRNFRQTLSTVQRFWQGQLIKMEYQMAALLLQWNKFETNALSSRVNSIGYLNRITTAGDMTLSSRKGSLIACSKCMRGSLCDRLSKRLCCIDDINNRRFTTHGIKIMILRGYVTTKRKKFWRDLKLWKLERHSWRYEETSRDDIMDKARQMIQQEQLVDELDPDHEFISKYPKPFFSLVLNDIDFASLVRQSHIEQSKINAREKRKNRSKYINNLKGRTN